LAILLGESSRFTRTALPLALALYFLEPPSWRSSSSSRSPSWLQTLQDWPTASRSYTLCRSPWSAPLAGRDSPGPRALACCRRRCFGRCGAPKPNPAGRADEAPSPTARLMTVDVKCRNRSFPEYTCAKPGWGRHGPGAHAVREIHRRERFTPGTLSSPDVREVRWFLHLRYARDVPGKAPIQRSSANGRAISAGTSDAS
jgi:hypothetical protein